MTVRPAPLFTRLALFALSVTTLVAVQSPGAAYGGTDPASAHPETALPQVMMIGVFHFNDQGLDAVKVEQTDVMSAGPQAYLDAMTERIAENYHPTRILLEYAKDDDATVQERYQGYLAGTWELQRNEIYQLGFRLAKAAGGIPIEGFDDRAIGWDAGPLMEVMPTSDPDLQAKFDATIQELTSSSQAAQETLSLGELLMRTNDPEVDRENMDLYLLTNPVSTNGEGEGSRAASSWWHRNFRMYANIQRAAHPGERLLVIGGQGHTAILKSLASIDRRIVAVDPREYLLP